jgi:nicotinamidase-related amidase
MISPHLKQLRPFLARGDFVAGSRGHAIVPELAEYVDAFVSKVAYSAFFNTQLDWVLRRAGIDTLAVCGIVTNGGVASTARDAHMRDYRVLVLADGCAASTQTAHDAALADLRTVADVISCEAFAGRLAA